ncbi:hypothetical protein FKP32DRAFT_1613227 [Trametes sanguinea]|nr:hypothetical protein FKP32DRAFT_1613227 [Trametes sanguinea]
MSHPQLDLTVLSLKELEDIPTGRLIIPRSVRRPKAVLVEYLLTHSDEELRRILSAAVAAKLNDRAARLAQKRQREAEQGFQRQRCNPDAKQYLDLPSHDAVLECQRQFFKATGKHSTAKDVCAICARLLFKVTDRMELIPLASLGDLDRLRPRLPHPAHRLVDGCLLDPQGVRVEGTRVMVMTCRHKPDDQSYQRQLRGTVSTYELSSNAVCSMLEGGLMPQLPQVLASVITVTFVGRGKLPKGWLRTTFRVRRHHVGEALRWLREHNERYYGDIVISANRLALLPEDDVPEELLLSVKQCNDAEVAMQESAGYVPDPEEDDLGPPTEKGQRPVFDRPPDVVPIQVAGAIDTDLSKLSATDLMTWGLANLWSSGHEGGYAIRHGGQPVADFRSRAENSNSHETDNDTANYFERAFPCLFPYGMGGLEGRQHTKVDFREHVQWALQYHDRRFRTHETFSFKRQALMSARIQMRRKDFAQQSRIIAGITTETLTQAANEEAAVKLLKRVVYGAAGRVQGSDASRQKIRAQIWSTCLIHGPPSFDIHDPIAQVFAGADIDLDDFLASAGPTVEQRARNVAQDPFAAAEFFHFMIDAIVSHLYRLKITPFSVKGEDGVLGKVSAFVGAVETQGRGMLHLHLLVWLANTPSADDLGTLFADEEFRNKVKAYIASNIRAYMPGLESAESTRAIPKEKDISFNRPVDPFSPSYATDVKVSELRLARAQQVHSCKFKQCLFVNGKGQLVCKRKAPFEYAADDYVEANGRWGPKRLFRFMNAWNPSTLVNVRCNNDIKLLTNGADTKNITFYVSSYASKKQGRNYNMSAVLASGFAYDATHQREQYAKDLRETQRLLVFRLVHAINREQELAAPLVMSYLMGWEDVKTSHTYSPLYWSTFVAALRRAHSGLFVAEQK